MCTWTTETAAITGSGKGASGWFPLSRAVVYYDHPYHAPLDHALNINFVNEALGPSARVAVELTAESARALVGAILAALQSADAHDSEAREGAAARVV
jgi:hypothetical protein